MARRRMIDPNIWGSEDMGSLTIRQRLLVIGLFSNADDYGKGKAKAAFIRSTIFPYDDIPLNEIYDDLESIGSAVSVEFYEVDGNSYYKFTNWQKWQTVQKPQISIIPDLVENHSLLSPEPFSPKGKEEKLKERKEEEKGREEGNAHAPISDIESLKTHLHNLIKSSNIKSYTIYDLDVIYSYIGVVDVEIIEAAIKKATNKDHINYAINTLNGMIKEGKTKKEHLFQKPVPGQAPINGNSSYRGRSGKPELKIVNRSPQALPTPEELEEIRKLARELDEAR